MFNSQTPLPQNYFKFETDFIGSLQCIPMSVRMKLDNCGVKLKLSHWNQFSQKERHILVQMPCISQVERKIYKQQLQEFVIAHTGQAAQELDIPSKPPWLNLDVIPDTVKQQAQKHQVSLSVEQWINLDPAQRFALIKLSRPSHENNNFMPALEEFGII